MPAPINLEGDRIAMLAAAILGGQQQQEQITYNAHTQFLVPLMQAGGLLIAAASLVGGFVALAIGFVWTATGLETLPDRLFISAALVAGSLLLAGGERYATRRLGRQPGLWRTLLSLVVRLLLVLLAFDVVYAISGEWGAKQTATLAVGLAAILVGSLLTWRFTNELWNPLYPRSPWASMVERFFTAMQGQEPETRRELVPYPVVIGNGTVRPLGGQVDEDEGIDGMAPEFGDLVAFGELAAEVGLSREKLITRPRKRLPSGEVLDRGKYDALLAELVQWRLVTPGGGGVAASWLVEPTKAVSILRGIAAWKGGQATGQAGSKT